MEEAKRDGRSEEEQVPEGEQEQAPTEVREAPTPIAPSAPTPSRWALVTGWTLFIVALVFALFFALQWQQQRAINQRLGEELEQMRQAVTAARKVFLERATAELGYASVDLQADPPKRYQVSFRLDEAMRWLRDAEPLLSERGRQQSQSIQQALRQLPPLVEQDPVNARQELAKVQDALAQLMRDETMAAPQ